MKKTLLIALLLSGSLKAQDHEIIVSAYIGAAASHTPWKSFSAFRKEYNTVNASSIKNKLGSLSERYGFNVGGECFIARHFYAAVEWNRLTSRSSATFTNDSKRYFSLNTNTINCYIGWKQYMPKGAWILATGVGFAFGNLNGWIKFPDGTRYYNTSGFSGEFTDVNFGFPLKFDYERTLSERFSWKIGVQGQFYTGTFESGMQNVFGTQTTDAVKLNGKPVKMDIFGVMINTGIVFNIYTL